MIIHEADLLWGRQRTAGDSGGHRYVVAVMCKDGMSHQAQTVCDGPGWVPRQSAPDRLVMFEWRVARSENNVMRIVEHHRTGITHAVEMTLVVECLSAWVGAGRFPRSCPTADAPATNQ